MYQDEYGNLWASYEDYQDYLKISSEIASISDELLEKTISEEISSKHTKVESGQNNE